VTDIRVTINQNTGSRLAVQPAIAPASVRAVQGGGGSGGDFDPSPVYAHTNIVFGVANAAYGVANTANQEANLAYAAANASYGAVNSLTSVVQITFGVANTGNLYANLAFRAANAAYDFANTINIKVDSAYGVANVANARANLAQLASNAAYDFANNINIKTDAAFGVANNANLYANLAFRAANAAYDFANTINIKTDAAFSVANVANVRGNLAQMASNAAYDFANTINIKTDAAFAVANNANVYANLAFRAANAVYDFTNVINTIARSAFDQANSSNLVIAGNTMSNGYYATRATRRQLNFIPASANVRINVDDDSAGDRINVTIEAMGSGGGSGTGANLTAGNTLANGFYFTRTTPLANINFIDDSLTKWNVDIDTVNFRINVHSIASRAPFDTANTANLYANLAFRAANAAYDFANAINSKVDYVLPVANAAFVVANNANVYANLAFRAANAVYDFANTININVAATMLVANTANVRGNLAQMASNAAYDFANVINSIARAAYTKANTTGVLSIANTLQANSYVASRSTGRSTLNFVPGTDIVVEITDDSSGDRTNIKIISTATSGVSAGFVYDATNAAFFTANTANQEANLAFMTANASYALLNTTVYVANLAFDKANVANGFANTINTQLRFSSVTLSVNSITGTASPANPLAGDPFDKISSALAWDSGNVFSPHFLRINLGTCFIEEPNILSPSQRVTSLRIQGNGITQSQIGYTNLDGSFALWGTFTLPLVSIVFSNFTMRSNVTNNAYEAIGASLYTPYVSIQTVKFVNWAQAIALNQSNHLSLFAVRFENEAKSNVNGGTFCEAITATDGARITMFDAPTFKNVAFANPTSTSIGKCFNLGKGATLVLPSVVTTDNCDSFIWAQDSRAEFPYSTGSRVFRHNFQNGGNLPQTAVYRAFGDSVINFANATIEFSAPSNGSVNVANAGVIRVGSFANVDLSQTLNDETPQGLIRDNNWRPVANIAFDKANAANILAFSSFIVANVANDRANLAQLASNAAYDFANVINTIARSAFAQANAPVYVSDTSPGSPVANSLWYKSDTGAMFIHYNDGSSSQWVEVGALGDGYQPSQEVLSFALSDETSPLIAGTNKLTFYFAKKFVCQSVYGALSANSSSGNTHVNIKKNGTTIFTTNITIMAANAHSRFGGSQPTLSSTTITFQQNDKMNVDIDLAGTNAAGLKVHLFGYYTD
jgi:hypothetical protein